MRGTLAYHGHTIHDPWLDIVESVVAGNCVTFVLRSTHWLQDSVGLFLFCLGFWGTSWTLLGLGGESVKPEEEVWL